MDLPQEVRENFRTAIWNLNGYIPSREQWLAHEYPGRIKMVAGGIRGGKSYSAAMELLANILVEDGLFWIVAPDYSQARAEFEYIMQGLEKLDAIEHPISLPSRGPAQLKTKWGATVQTKSSDDVIKLASFAPDGIIMAEAAQQPYEVFFKLLERCLEKRAWLWMCGTFESSLGWYADKYEEWKEENPSGIRSFSVPTWSNLAVFPEGREDPGIKALEAQMPPELFLERCGAIPCPPQGLVFPEYNERIHVTKLEYNPKLPLELACDPASHTYSVLFIQWDDDGNVYIIDEIYERGNVLAQHIIPKVTGHELWPYVSSGVMDRAGKQHHANKSQLDVWREELMAMGEKPMYWRWSDLPILEKDWRAAIKLRLHDPGINAARLFVSDELVNSRTMDGKALGIRGEFLTYRWGKQMEGRAEKQRPIKANEDALSALGYWLVDKFGLVIDRLPFGQQVKRAYWH